MIAVTFETYFRASSYLMIACGALALAISEGVSWGLGAMLSRGRLNVLNLNRTAVGDEGIAHLSGLGQLTNLSMNATAVTDAGLVHLHGLTTLRYVFMERTAVTPAGVGKLRAALPRAVIFAPATLGVRRVGSGG